VKIFSPYMRILVERVGPNGTYFAWVSPREARPGEVALPVEGNVNESTIGVVEGLRYASEFTNVEDALAASVVVRSAAGVGGGR